MARDQESVVDVAVAVRREGRGLAAELELRGYGMEIVLFAHGQSFSG